MELMEDHSHLASNTMFEKGRRWLWMWLSPSGTKAQIGFILTRQKWRNSVVDSGACSTFSSMESDHRIVAMNV